MLEAVSRKLEISEQTFHRWQHIYDGTKEPEMARLKKIVAKEAMDTGAMKSPLLGTAGKRSLWLAKGAVRTLMYVAMASGAKGNKVSQSIGSESAARL